MKIDPGLKPIQIPPSVETRPTEMPATKSDAAEQTPVSLSPRASQLNLSPRASQLNQMETELATIAVVDRSRVDSIKAALAAGQYIINPANIADSLLTSAKEILHVSK